MVARTDIDRLERALEALTARVQRIEANTTETKVELGRVRVVAMGRSTELARVVERLDAIEAKSPPKTVEAEIEDRLL